MFDDDVKDFVKFLALVILIEASILVVAILGAAWVVKEILP